MLIESFHFEETPIFYMYFVKGNMIDMKRQSYTNYN